MLATSVKALQLRPDADVLSQDARERPLPGCALEAREAAARVGAATGLLPAGDEHALAGGEAEQLALRRPPPAAGAPPQRLASYDSCSGCSTGIPAGTSSGSATSASGATGGSPESTSAGSASAAGSSTSTSSASAASASAGGPAT